LAETLGHPLYLGVKGAREQLKVLNKKLNLKLNLDKLDKEIKDCEDWGISSQYYKNLSGAGN